MPSRGATRSRGTARHESLSVHGFSVKPQSPVRPSEEVIRPSVLAAERAGEVRACSKCSDSAVGKAGKFCVRHAAERRRKKVKYAPTPEIDAMIAESWRSSDHGKAASLFVQERTGWPHWKVVRRAGEIGVARRIPKEPVWSKEEIRVLEQFAWMCPDRIKMKIRALCGTIRTRTAVVLKRKRLRLLSNLDGYTLRRLGALLGEDAHKIARWIKAGWLSAQASGVACGANEKAYIPHKNVRAFILAHSEEIDLCKVEKLWFLDCITDGKIGVRESDK